MEDKINLLEDVKKIMDKYNLNVFVPDEYINVYKYLSVQPEKKIEDFKHPIINDSYLCEKYKNNIPKGWYGFEIGNPTPINWFIVIEKIVDFLIKKDPDFEIHQIKMKFGGIRFYCESEKIEDIDDISMLIETKLFDKKLIY